MTSRQGRLARWCWRLVDAGLVIAVPITALAFGGRHDLGRLVYIVGVALAATGLLAARCVEAPRSRSTATYWLLLLAIGCVSLQLVSLPQEWIVALAPGLAERLPAWRDGAGGFGAWTTLSLAPDETRLGLALLTAHATLFFVLMQRVSKPADARRLVGVLAGLAGGMALLGIAQWLLSNDHMLWIYRHPSRDFGQHVQGSFANKNHFANFVIMGLPACLVLAVRSWLTRSRPAPGGDRILEAPREWLARWGWTTALLVAALAVLLTQSRGGLVSMVIALASCLLLMRGKGLAATRVGPLWIAVLAVTLAGGLVVGENVVTDTARLGAALQAGEIAGETGRAEIWQANIEAFTASPWFGWGAGSHRFVYPLFLTQPTESDFTHAESGYLQIASETGIVGLALLASTITLVLSWCWRLARSSRSDSAWIACALIPALAASLVQSIADFVWYIPACMAMTIAAAVGVLRLLQLNTAPTTQPPADVWFLAWARAAVVWGVSLAMMLAYVGPARASLDWDRYLRISRTLRDYIKVDVERDPGNATRHNQTLRQYVARMNELLDGVIAARPSHVRAHLRLASRHRQAFELNSADQPNVMTAWQISEAALAAEFTDLDDTKRWLVTACGDDAGRLESAHRHALRAVRLCPLAGEAYTALAELSFLSPPAQRDRELLIEQALATRPNEGLVLYEAGLLHQRLGSHKQAQDLWRRCVEHPGSHRQALALMMCESGVPAAEFLAAVDPPWPMYRIVYRIYQKMGTAKDLAALASFAIRLAKGGRAPAPDKSDFLTSRQWIIVSELRQKQADMAGAVAAATRAYQLLPNDFVIRRQLAESLMSAGRSDEAEPHLRWCLARRPELRGLREALAMIRRDAIAANTASFSDVKQKPAASY